MQVLADLLCELDAMSPRPRLLALVQGVLAGNIFDWGAQVCVYVEVPFRRLTVTKRHSAMAVQIKCTKSGQRPSSHTLH